MSPIQTEVTHALGQLDDLLSKLSDAQYQSQVPVLSGSSLGAHTRHIIEFFLELLDGYERGVVNYDARKRNQKIESDRLHASGCLASISRNIDRQNKSLSLQRHSDYRTPPELTATNYDRELLFNLDHLTHHLALIRIGVDALAAIELPVSFGVSSATMMHRSAH